MTPNASLIGGLDVRDSPLFRACPGFDDCSMLVLRVSTPTAATWTLSAASPMPVAAGGADVSVILMVHVVFGTAVGV